MEPYMISEVSASFFSKSKMFPSLLFILPYYCTLQLYIFAALYCCPPLYSKKHVKINLLTEVLLCCHVLLYTLLPYHAPPHIGFFVCFFFFQVSNNRVLLPFFSSQTYCCNTVSNKTWHLGKTF